MWTLDEFGYNINTDIQMFGERNCKVIVIDLP